jgi:hypothetical protein
MRAWPGIMLLATGCRGLLGIDDVQVRDASTMEPETLIDAPPDAVLGPYCYGAGLVRICLQAVPANTRMLAGAVDTDTTCELVDQGFCVITGDTITIPNGIARATGSRPLVLVAARTITVDGTLDVSSGVGGSGAAANFAGCQLAMAGESDTGGGGGGAGASFVGRGGNGGDGDVNNNGLPVGPGSGGLAAAAFTATSLHGGCRGGAGGAGNGASGAPGAGGGAVYLIAGASIDVAGAVTANGGGGVGGSITSGGGGGGGSGGFVGFDAPMTLIAGVATANGGGGGEGASQTAGVSGADGAASQTPALGGSGVPDAGDGGSGSGNGVLTGTGAGSGDGGGGGGGGGAGIVYVKGALTTPGIVSPTATQLP